MPKVLLADDSTHAQRMGTKILSAEGIDVVTVSNGEAAVKKLDVEFDVVLADVFMPGRSGYELCTFIKNSPKFSHIPVVLVVGQLEPYDPEQGKKSRADGVLKKPFEASVVVETVRAMVALAKERRSAAAPPPSPPPPTAEEIAQDQKDLDDIPSTKTERIQVPKDMEHSAAFDLFDEPAPPVASAAEPTVAMPALSFAAVDAAPAAPGESAYGVVQDAAPSASAYGVVEDAAPSASAYGVVEDAAPSASAYGVVEDGAPSASAYGVVEDAAPSASAYGVVEEGTSSYGGEDVGEIKIEVPAVTDFGDSVSPEAMEDVSLPGLAPAELDLTMEIDPIQAPAAVVLPDLPGEAAPAAPPKVLRWVAEPEGLTDVDRALFASPATAAAPVESVASVESVAGVAAAAPADAAPDWSDLLRSVEEPAPTRSPASARAATETSAAVAIVEPVIEPLVEPLEPVVEQLVEQLVEQSAPVANAAPVDSAKLRAGIEAGLEKALPSIKLTSKVIDTISEEVLRHLNDN